MKWGALLGFLLVVQVTAHEETAPRVKQAANQETLRCESPQDEVQLVGITEQ